MTSLERKDRLSSLEEAAPPKQICFRPLAELSYGGPVIMFWEQAQFFSAKGTKVSREEDLESQSHIAA